MRTWLTIIRTDKKMTKSQVAKCSKISLPYYSQIESGQRNLRTNTAKIIAEVLNFDWTKFYEEE